MRAFLRRIHSVIEFSSKDNFIECGSGLQYIFPEEFENDDSKTIPDSTEDLDLPF